MNLDSINEFASLKNIQINQGSFTDLCVIGTHLHLFETPRYGRTDNLSNYAFNSHAVEETGDEPA